MPVSIFRWQRSTRRSRRAAAACSARAADGVEMVGVRSCSNTPSRSLIAERAEDQNRQPDAGGAEDDALLDVGAGEHRRACALERQRHLGAPGRRHSP